MAERVLKLSYKEIEDIPAFDPEELAIRIRCRLAQAGFNLARLIRVDEAYDTCHRIYRQEIL